VYSERGVMFVVRDLLTKLAIM